MKEIPLIHTKNLSTKNQEPLNELKCKILKTEMPHTPAT